MVKARDAKDRLNTNKLKTHMKSPNKMKSPAKMGSGFKMKSAPVNMRTEGSIAKMAGVSPMKKPGFIDTVKNVGNKALNAGSKLVNYLDDVTSKTDSAKNFNTKRKTNYGEKESGAKKASSLKGTTPGHFTMPEKIQA